MSAASRVVMLSTPAALIPGLRAVMLAARSARPITTCPSLVPKAKPRNRPLPVATRMRLASGLLRLPQLLGTLVLTHFHGRALWLPTTLVGRTVIAITVKATLQSVSAPSIVLADANRQPPPKGSLKPLSPNNRRVGEHGSEDQAHPVCRIGSDAIVVPTTTILRALGLHQANSRPVPGSTTACYGTSYLTYSRNDDYIFPLYHGFFQVRTAAIPWCTHRVKRHVFRWRY